MKSCTTSLLLATSLVIGSALTSCVVPADGNASTTTTTYTDYQPGYRINSLPSGYRSEVISGSTYYYKDGHYYRSQSGGYVIVDAPHTSRYYSDYGTRRSTTTYQDDTTGDVHVINTLPTGYKEINHRGSSYYQVGDQYYRRKGGGYVTVASPY